MENGKIFPNSKIGLLNKKTSGDSIHIYEDELALAKSIKINELSNDYNEMKNFGNATIKNLKRFFLDFSKYYNYKANFYVCL